MSVIKKEKKENVRGGGAGMTPDGDEMRKLPTKSHAIGLSFFTTLLYISLLYFSYTI